MKARESCSVPVARFVPEPFNECRDKLPLVYICSRYRGKDETDVREHIRWAKAFSCFALERHAVPVAPHLFYPQFLDDDDPRQRSYGIMCADRLLMRCDEVWVFNVDGISEGMASEIALADAMGKPVRVFDVLDV